VPKIIALPSPENALNVISEAKFQANAQAMEDIPKSATPDKNTFFLPTKSAIFAHGT